MAEKPKATYDLIFFATIAVYGLLVVAGVITALVQSGRPPSIDLNFSLRIEEMIEQAQIDEAMIWIEQDVQVNFTDLNRPERYVMWGDKLQEHKHYDQAIQCYQSAIEFDEKYWPAHYSLGLTYGLQNQLTEAIEHLQIAAKIAPSNQDVRRALRDAQNARSAAPRQ